MEQQARRNTARAAAAEQAERERQAAAAADVARQTLACVDCGLQRAAGLCEACDHACQTETLISEVGFLAAAWSVDLTGPGSIAAVTVQARTAIGASIAAAWQEFLQITEEAALEASPEAAQDAYAFAALQAVREYQDTARAMLGRTEEAEAEARRAYKAEQGRHWFQHNPHGADAIAAAARAADKARGRVAEYLLAARLKQLRELAARPLEGDTAGAVSA